MPERNDPNRWRKIFQAATAEWGLPPGLLEKVAEVESSFNPEAVSPAGAVGLMQIIPRWHPDVDPTDPVASIHYAARYLSELKDRFGEWDLALAAYNAGPTNVRRYEGIPPFQETQNYVKRIMSEVAFEEPSQLDTQVNNILADHMMLPDATRVSIPEQVETRMAVDEVQTLMQPDATRVSPQRPRLNLLEQISSHLPEVPVGIQALLTGDNPTDQAIRDFRSNLPKPPTPLQALLDLVESPAGVALGATGPAAAGAMGRAVGSVAATGAGIAKTASSQTPSFRNQVAIFNQKFLEAKTPRQMDNVDQHHSLAFSKDALKVEKSDGALAFVNPVGEVTVSVAPNSPLTTDEILRNLNKVGMPIDNVTVIRQTADPSSADKIETLGKGPVSSLVSPSSSSQLPSQITQSLTDQEFSRRMRDIAVQIEADDLISSFSGPSHLDQVREKIHRAIEIVGDLTGARVPDELKDVPARIIMGWALSATGLSLKEAREILAERGETISGALKEALLELINFKKDEENA